MSVSSLNVETGSIAEGSTEGDDDRSVVTPIKDTPPASVLMGGRDTDVPDMEADADDRPVTPTSSIGGRLADVDLEDRTERELEAYEAETEDQPRQPEDVGAPVSVEPEAGAVEERIVPHAAETAHEIARERTVTPPPESNEPIDPTDSAAVEQAEDASLVATVPGNALAAMQPSPERTSRNQDQPLREPLHGPTSPLASSTTPTPVVSAVVPVPPEADVADQRPTPNATPHAEDVERLQSDTYGADDEALAVMTGSKPVPGAPADAIVTHEDEQPAADVLDSLMDESPEPPVDVPTSAAADDMPSVRCSDCSALVPLMDLGEHTCEPAIAAQSPERRTASSTSTVQPTSAQSDDFVRQQDALVPEDVTADDDPETPVAPVAPMPSPSHDLIDAHSQVHDDETDSPMDAQFPAPPSPRSRQDSAASIDGIPAPGSTSPYAIWLIDQACPASIRATLKASRRRFGGVRPSPDTWTTRTARTWAARPPSSRPRAERGGAARARLPSFSCRRSYPARARDLVRNRGHSPILCIPSGFDASCCAEIWVDIRSICIRFLALPLQESIHCDCRRLRVLARSLR